MNIRKFSGGIQGVPPGACGLLTAIGKFDPRAILRSADCLQYRGRNGAGITLKGVYPFESADLFHFHIMYRTLEKKKELDTELQNMGLEIEEQSLLVEENWYAQYDMPRMFHYRIRVRGNTTQEQTEHSIMQEVRKKVTKFNTDFTDEARIFSSGRDLGTFLTAFHLDDTMKVFDIEQYLDRNIQVLQCHMRWPTSAGRGLWWGPQPISLGDVSGTHNGHLSSDKSNAIALEQLGIRLHVGTDSEAIFKEMHYLLESHYSLREMEWIISRKFPKEVELLEEVQKRRYQELVSDPILNRFKISGPTTAIVLIGNLVIALTDRDHLRPFTVGYNDQMVLLASEERALISSAFMMDQEIKIQNPEAGKLLAFQIDENKIPQRLEYEWKKVA